MIDIIRTSSDHHDFVRLVGSLDAELAQRDGEDHAFYSQFNTVDTIRHVVVAYENGVPVGCGAIKEHSPGTMEIKRMYVPPGHRKKGIATKILSALELWAVELSCTTCILETGKRQPEALALYKGSGYTVIPNYGQYAGMDNSVCFTKNIKGR